MVTIKVTNTKRLIDAFEKYGDEVVDDLKDVIKIRALEIEGEAKRLAPVDNGQLRQSIKSEMQESPLNYKITAYMPYSAYMEFGTGGNVDIPRGWEDMAAESKGKGIRQVNISPRPFMYPAFLRGGKLFQKDIKNLFKELNKKFNR